MADLGKPQNTIAVLQKYNFNFQKKFGNFRKCSQFVIFLTNVKIVHVSKICSEFYRNF